MTSTHEGNLDLPMLPAEATHCDLFPQMGLTLILIPQLCSYGCMAVFTKHKVVISYQDHPIMEGA